MGFTSIMDYAASLFSFFIAHVRHGHLRNAMETHTAAGGFAGLLVGTLSSIACF